MQSLLGLFKPQDTNKWGGAIELSILSRHLQREIAAFDISTLRVGKAGLPLCASLLGHALGLWLAPRMQEGRAVAAAARTAPTGGPRQFPHSVTSTDKTAGTASACCSFTTVCCGPVAGGCLCKLTELR